MNLQTKLKNITSNTDIVKIHNDSIAFAISQIIENSDKNLFVHIVKNDLRASEIESQIKFFCPDINILMFPAWDCLPYDSSSPKSNIISKRIETLFSLNKEINEKTLLITTINSILQKTTPISKIDENGFILKNNDEITIEALIEILIKNGYDRSITADNVGEFAVRGSIVDIVTQINDENQGFRVDFFGDKIDSIRNFDPLTQISSEKVKSINFLPSQEIILNDQTINIFKQNYRKLFGLNKNDLIYENITSRININGIEHFMPLFFETKLDNIFDYISKHNNTLLIENEIEQHLQDRLSEIELYFSARVDTLKESAKEGNIYNPIPISSLYLDETELKNKISNQHIIRFDNFDNKFFDRPLDLEIKQIPDFSLASKANKRNVFDLFLEFCQNNLSRGKILIACNSQGSAARLSKILLNHEIPSVEIKNISDVKDIKKGTIALCIFKINLGFYNNNVSVISEDSLLGQKKRAKKLRKSNPGIITESLGINIGDLIVHKYHGIGRFEGLQNITAGNITNDFVKLTYHGGDNLFLPVEDMNLITRYGENNSLIQLDKLGSSAWKNRSSKIKKRIKVAAEQLIKIAALRKTKKSPILIPNLGEYEEFAAKFEFVETDDQMRAINEIEDDLQKGQPMDRLICGDVGFGKTEVAMRAAFIAAKNETKKFQVAIVTPTTLLSRQHYNNFCKRFENTGLKIAQLSRMVSPANSKIVKEQLEKGEVDIIVGTHALLNKNIKFKNLGLVIIDEEQHFGVSQKERLKELRSQIHILTLSATPIPRTLQMSLTGVKDLSLIATPPIDRIAIRNFVMDYDPVIIREAILREFHRGGKIFFVVPKIKDLEEIHPKLEKLIPEVKIKAAHGQMAPSTLDDIMNQFYDGKFHILLSTTIIESGIDIKDANTIIIHKAHMFGLSQLYQLRGRVGRGHVRAYSYLTTPPKRKLTDPATKKLQVMQTIDSLGAGFSIASHDMDIRGSGNILGDEQSGHIKETGVELYQNMLNEAIANLKTANQHEINETIEDYQTLIKLKISLLIPEDYIQDLSLRLSFYKRISSIKSLEEREDIEVEIIDRFGKAPEAVTNLLDVSYIKYLCKKCNVEKLESKKDGILITFKDNNFRNPDKLLEMVFSSNNKIQLKTHQLLFLENFTDNTIKINFCQKILEKLINISK